MQGKQAVLSFLQNVGKWQKTQAFVRLPFRERIVVGMLTFYCSLYRNLNR